MHRLDWNSLFNYIDGELFWAITKGSNAPVGKIAGNVMSTAYWCVMVNGKTYYRHRIIWEMFNGPIPEGMEVDHINDIAGDDRIENLQLLTGKQNTAKIRNSLNVSKVNTSGVKGVCFVDRGGNRRPYWKAAIQISGKSKHLGGFQSLLDAVAARMRAEREYHWSNKC